MFIGGLNWETTDRESKRCDRSELPLKTPTESLKDYFSKFGEVAECVVMRDGASGRSRGFGFLTFRDPKTVNVVMVKEHYLDGKIVSTKKRISKVQTFRSRMHRRDTDQLLPDRSQASHSP